MRQWSKPSGQRPSWMNSLTGCCCVTISTNAHSLVLVTARFHLTNHRNILPLLWKKILFYSEINAQSGGKCFERRSEFQIIQTSLQLLVSDPSGRQHLLFLWAPKEKRNYFLSLLADEWKTTVLNWPRMKVIIITNLTHHLIIVSCMISF